MLCFTCLVKVDLVSGVVSGIYNFWLAKHVLAKVDLVSGVVYARLVQVRDL